VPRFTILLPTHNRADVLHLALQSVLWQTDPDFEVLIVGDGCTDHTAEVIASFDDARFRWFDLPKAAGFGYANRNIALREARGDLIAFLGHDNLLLPDHLALMGECFERSDVPRSSNTLFAYSRPLWVTRDGQIVPSAVNLRDPYTVSIFLNRFNLLPATCVVYRREAHDAIGLWDESITAGGDWHFWKRIIAWGGLERVAYQPVPTCLHFTANWRAGDYVDTRPELRGWGGEGVDLPPALSVPIPDGITEQQAFLDAMQPDSIAWTHTIRSAVTDALDAAAFRYHFQAADLRRLTTENARLTGPMGIPHQLARLLIPSAAARDRLAAGLLSLFRTPK
jgi:hypothetical protein